MTDTAFIFPSQSPAPSVVNHGFQNPSPGERDKFGRTTQGSQWEIEMNAQRSEPVTELLLRWRQGNEDCLSELIALLEGELRRIAHRQMRLERADHTLQTTALVNEAYIRLIDQQRVIWQNRAQFLGVAAQVMRRILVDHARGIARGKRGAGAFHLPLDEGLVFSPEKSAALLALDEALDRLAAFDPRKAHVVELRYFGGMNVDEAAESLGVHPNTVIRDWSLAKAWLKRELTHATANAG
jgi:RNA polymerase sigma-70 factor (ECF subfamily)